MKLAALLLLATAIAAALLSRATRRRMTVDEYVARGETTVYPDVETFLASLGRRPESVLAFAEPYDEYLETGV